jgi:hypothetical protein
MHVRDSAQLEQAAGNDSGRDLSICVLTRDKFSTAPATVAALLVELPAAEVLIVDIGYPDSIRAELQASAMRVNWITAPRYANTNVALNRAVAAATREFVLVVENDVSIDAATVPELKAVVAAGYDIAVPVVLESDGSTHFDPPLSRIEDEPAGVRSILVRRPDAEHARIGNTRRVAHLEKHCFLLPANSARRLGPLDEETQCRTDVDLSMQCRQAGLRIGMSPVAHVRLRSDLDLAIDRELFAYRWDLDITARANERLISKWRLIEYSSSLRFAKKMQERLETLLESGDA